MCSIRLRPNHSESTLYISSNNPEVLKDRLKSERTSTRIHIAYLFYYAVRIVSQAQPSPTR